MVQLFRPKDNAIFRGTLIASGVGLLLLIMVMDLWQQSSYQTQAGIEVPQEVPFSHQHHVAGLGLDCRFCHTSVEKSSFAGMPSTETCMKCHREIWRDSPMLQQVRDSDRTGRPLVWRRVNKLPDFVYFDHSIHVTKGIACQTCHGPVEQMPLMRKENTLYMRWCLDCHRHPGHYVAQPPADLTQQRIKQIQNCSACHR